MKSTLLSLLVVFAFTGCLELKGTLTNTEPITLNALENDGATYPVNYKPDTQPGRLKVDKNIIEIIIGRRHFPFITTQDLRHPTNGQEIVIKAEESKQPYDVKAIYTETDKATSEIGERTQECKTLQGTDGQLVAKFQSFVTTYTLEAHLVNPADQKAMGTFSGKFVGMEHDNYISYGDCITP